MEYPAFFGFAPTVPDGIDYGELAGRALDQSIDEVFGADRPARLETRVVARHPALALVEASEGADLLVVGSRGYGGQHLLHPSRALSGHGHPASRPPAQVTGQEDNPVRAITESKLGAVLGGLPGTPRVVMSGNFGTPWRALSILDTAVAEYHLFALNAQPGVPDRDGVVLESAFVGPGMRRSERLRYFPCRLSLVPDLLIDALPPDVVLLHTSTPVNGTVSLGIEVNILPAAIDAALARGGLVIAQVNPRMPYTQGDAVLPADDIDYGIEVDEPLPSPQPPAS